MKKDAIIIDYFLDSVKKFPQKDALLYRKGHHFEGVSYERFYDIIVDLFFGLKGIGIQEGDKVVLISENRPEWTSCDLAFLSLGVVNVPIHEVLSAKQMHQIISEVEPKAIFVSNQENLGKLEEIKDEIKDIEHIVSFEKLDSKKLKKLVYFIDILKLGKNHRIIEDFEKSVAELSQDDLASIIYTSGTTGRFKGAPLTHKNFVSNACDLLKVVKVTEEDKFLSILPLSHVFERTVGYYVPLFAGACVSYIEDPLKLGEIAKEEKPTIIIAVPRLFEKVYEAIQKKAVSSPIKSALFSMAFKEGEKYQEAKKKSKNAGPSFLYSFFDKLVFKKVKKEFGGKIRFFVSGAAPLQKKVALFFEALDLVVLEGYGLTETSPVVTCNRLEKYKFATAGLPLPSVEVKISKDGEILVKGPNVINEYYKNEKATKEAFTPDGWFKTGDLGFLDKDGFLKITGRIKEIIVLSTGKNISPQIIEEKLELSPYISQAFVFGDGKKHIGALIKPEFDNLKKRFGDKRRDLLIKDEEVIKFLKEEVDENCQNFAHYEKVKKFVLITEPFTIKNGCMTLTMKLRRKEIEKKYKEEIKGIYR